MNILGTLRRHPMRTGIGGLVLLLFFFGIDHWLGRPARIELAMAKERTRKLRDAILRFKLDTERFPRNLAELTPGYAPKELLPPHLWDPISGTLSWKDPFPIRGLITRRRHFSLPIENLPVTRDPLTGENCFKNTPDQVVLDENHIVVEAELFQFMTYGWEIGEREDASGNCYIYLKEGRGDVDHKGVEFDPKDRSGDFFNTSGDMRRIEARCHFMAPQSGKYQVAVRTMALASTCSNIVYLQVNQGPLTRVGKNNTTPFVWLWHRIGQVRLKEGANSLAFKAMQDDLMVDQVVLSRKPIDLKQKSARIFAGGTAGKSDAGHLPPAVVSLSSDTLTVTKNRIPSVSIYVHKTVPDGLPFRISTSLDHPQHRRKERSHEFRMKPSDRLKRFSYELDWPETLDRKEYLFRCQLYQGENLIQERTLALLHGFDWSILGPLPFMEASKRAEPEQTERPESSYRFGNRTHRWNRYDETNTDRFGLIDFGKMFSGRTKNAMPNVSLYGYTEVRAKTAGEYLMKFLGDDSLTVWINGEMAGQITRYNETAIRNARQTRVRLVAGRNRVLFRLNQKGGQWQAGIRFRTLDDQVADVIGIPYSKQDTDFFSE